MDVQVGYQRGKFLNKVKNLFRKEDKQLKNENKPLTHTERIIVWLVVLIVVAFVVTFISAILEKDETAIGFAALIGVLATSYIIGLVIDKSGK